MKHDVKQTDLYYVTLLLVQRPLGTKILTSVIFLIGVVYALCR